MGKCPSCEYYDGVTETCEYWGAACPVDMTCEHYKIGITNFDVCHSTPEELAQFVHLTKDWTQEQILEWLAMPAYENPISEDEDSVWYVEKWMDGDLENAMNFLEIPVTQERLDTMRNACKYLFCDKTERNEMITEMTRGIFNID